MKTAILAQNQPMNSLLKGTLSLMLVALLLSSCGLQEAKKDAEKTMDVFHQKLTQKNFDVLFSMIDASVLEANSEEEVIQLFELAHSQGKIKSISQSAGFNTEIKNGLTSVQLTYVIHTELRDIEEKVTLVKRSKGFKIVSYFLE